MRQKVWFFLLTGLIFVSVSVAAQTIRNPRLNASDLEAATAAAKSAQGPDAELVYATRADAIEKGKLNCLVVVSAAIAGTGPSKARSA
jgi:hypothetical protein